MDEEKEDFEYLLTLSLEELLDYKIEVVTGSTGKGKTILNSSVAITLVTEQDLDRHSPFGLADTLKFVPGLYAQESGGQTSNSVGIRGLLASGHFEFISVQEDGLPVNYDRYLADAMLRYDLGFSHFEATRGGSSGVLAPNGAGAIINYISKMGGDENDALMKISQSDFDNTRIDLFWSGPIATNWTAAISGAYTKGDSPRRTGFNGENGGQIKGIFTRQLDQGEINLSYKYINESNSFVLPLPLFRDQRGVLKEIPGFDLSLGTTTSFDNRRTRILFADNQTAIADMEDGAYTKMNALTFNIKYELNKKWDF
ncbi:MAG: TonB-dependent receptor plug domain-containing protein [Kangiellaceae bacterium]|nr:TonB-dependent receptor plug domain-containing protein [Kangiellaceae bacterium]